MKLKKIMLVSIILLAILTLGAVSAAEDADELAVDVAEDDVVSSVDDVDNDVVNQDLDDEDSLSSENLDINVEFPENVTYGYNYVQVTIDNEDAQGTLVLYVDEESEDYDGEYEVDGSFNGAMSFFSNFGQHTLYLKYYGDEKYNDVVKTFSFNVNDYEISFEDDVTYKYGMENSLSIYMPSDAEGTVIVYVNGKKVATDTKTHWESELYIRLNETALDYGENTVKVEFIPEEDSIFESKTVETTVIAKGYIQLPKTIVYNGGEEIRLILPSDATGKLNIKLDKEEAVVINGENGIYSYVLPKLSVGDHPISANYEEDDEKYSANEYEEETFKVIPKVICPEHIKIDEENFVTIEMDEKYSGTFALYRLVYDDDPIFVGEVTLSEGKGEIPLTGFEKEGSYSLRAVYSEDEEDIFYFPDEYMSYEIYVTTESHDWKIKLDVPDEVMKYPDQEFEITNTPSFTPSGVGELYIDGIKVNCDYGSYSSIIFDASKLSEGPHTFVFKFLGDDYFNPTEVSGSFNVSDIVIEIPETYDMRDSEGYITIKLPADAKGIVIVKVGGTEIFNEEFDNEDYLNDYIRFNVDLDDLIYGINDVAVIVEGKYSATKTGKINAIYSMDIGQEHVRYGEGEVILNVPSDLTSEVILIINGVQYKSIKKVTVRDEEYIDYIVKIPKDLAVGNHEVVLKYNGDKKYGPREVTVNLTVVPEIIIPDGTIDKNTDEISITLPENATGALSIKIRKYNEGIPELFDEIIIPLEKGHASYSLKNLGWGKYNIIANYTGTDYEIYDLPEYGTDLSINPDISYPSKMIEGDNKYISINLPGIKGTLILDDEDFDREVELVNGKATIPLNMLPAGDYYLHVKFDCEWDESDGYDSYYYYLDITVQKPTIKASNLNAIYTANSVYKVQITGVDKNLIVGDKVTFKINNKVIGTGTIDKNGYASIKINKVPGNYKITTVYKKVSVTKKLTVKHIVTLKSVKVKKSAKKLVLQATVKVGKKPVTKKKITFKFNGKKYTAKTNAKGIAKVTIKKAVLKKLKAGKKVTYQATYLKDTVKKSVKVKK